MAVRHRLVQASPPAVWAVLADPDSYVKWVVGPSEVTPEQGQWPEVGATIHYEVCLGPARLTNETVVRRCEAGTALELEAKAGRLGTARIAVELRPWGEDCLVIVDEHPLRGPGGVLHNAGVELLIQLRHRAMLARLAELCETREGAARDGAAGGRRRPVSAARPGAGRA